MRYLGGKFQIRKKISTYLEFIRKKQQLYVEPFCGACSVVSCMSGKREASDIHAELIAFWQAVQNGYRGEPVVTEEMYKIAKNGNFSAEKKAFILFFCSFGGRYGQGFARSKNNYNYAQSQCASLSRIAPLLCGVKFKASSYELLHYKDALIYCDPPYMGTKKYINNINHQDFWNWCRESSKYNTIVISEYSAPKDFICVKEFNRNSPISPVCDRAAIRIERLFVHESIYPSLPVAP